MRTVIGRVKRDHRLAIRLAFTRPMTVPHRTTLWDSRGPNVGTCHPRHPRFDRCQPWRPCRRSPGRKKTATLLRRRAITSVSAWATKHSLQREKAKAECNRRKRIKEEREAAAAAAAAAQEAAAARPPQPSQQPLPPVVDVAGQLAKLAELKEQGILDDSMFEAAVAKVLAVSPEPQPPQSNSQSPPQPPSPPPTQSPPPPAAAVPPATGSIDILAVANESDSSEPPSDDDDDDEPAPPAPPAPAPPPNAPPPMAPPRLRPCRHQLRRHKPPRPLAVCRRGRGCAWRRTDRLPSHAGSKRRRHQSHHRHHRLQRRRQRRRRLRHSCRHDCPRCRRRGLASPRSPMRSAFRLHLISACVISSSYAGRSMSRTAPST